MASSGQAFDNRQGYIWLDGKFVKWNDAKLHVLTHSLHYGGAVFEGERAYSGKIFKCDEHSQRLKDSAKMLGYEIDFSVDEINKIKYETLEKNNLKDAYVRPVAWRGAEEMGLGAKNCKIHFSVAVWHWGSYFGEDKLKAGLKLKTSKWHRPPPNSIPCHAKASGLYMICTLSKHDAIDAGYDDELMLDWRGRVAECSAANIFFVFNGELHTPTPDCFLNGITRQTVIELAKNKGLKVVERSILPEEISEASECFVTGTAAEIVPVGQIDDIKYEKRDITFALRDEYIKTTGR